MAHTSVVAKNGKIVKKKFSITLCLLIWTLLYNGHTYQLWYCYLLIASEE